MDTHFELSLFFKVLGDETRLRLVNLLAEQQEGRALCVGKLAKELNTTNSNVSQHIRILKTLGLLHSNRSGYRIHYFLDQERLAHYQTLADRLFKKSLEDKIQSTKED